ncbi:MAG: glycosyltransferase family 2 protein [Vampirovibrionales bacterium]|nr:glycosyltransferase family 2 protein [Vampirovibrionales bacterium]
MPLVSILIPVFNELDWLPARFEALCSPDLQAAYAQVGLALELIAINDGSTDDSGAWLTMFAQSHPQLRVVHLAQNRGKGAAIHAGLEHARGEIIAIQDADLEYDPHEYPPLAQLIAQGHADAVYGTRLVPGKPVRAFNIWHYWGNQFLSLVTNVLYNTTLSDMETGCKLFRAELLKSLDLRENRFEFEPEVTAKLLKAGARLFEAPISYHGRDAHQGKKIRWTDGFGALWALMKYRI